METGDAQIGGFFILYEIQQASSSLRRSSRFVDPARPRLSGQRPCAAGLKRIGYQCVRTLAGSVDDGKVCASLGGGFEYLAQSGNLTGDNGGRFLASPVAPIRGGRLRVKVDHGNRTASQNRLYGYP
jgi:hypothetical protein